MNLKLYLIHDTKAIIKNWDVILEGLTKVLSYIDGDQTDETIFNEIIAGKLFMQMAFLDGKYIGFFTGRIDAIRGGKKFLTIVHTYIKPDVPAEVFFDGFKQIEAFAKSYDCNAMRFYTKRDKAFNRRLQEKGWTQSYVEFVKPIGGSDNGRR